MDGVRQRDSERQTEPERDWTAAYARLSSAAGLQRPSAAALTDLGVAAYLAGRDEEPDRHFGEAFRAATACGDHGTAVRAAFWASFACSNLGENARARGWAERARRTVASMPGRGTAEHCAVDLLEALLCLREGDAALTEVFSVLAGRASALGDCDLEALAVMGEGLSLVCLGHATAGMHRLDEALVAVSGREVHPMAAGLIYCVALDACHSTLDFRRSAQWTRALTDWCEGQPGLVPYRGQCLVHRVQVLQLRGSWAAALAEARRACALLSSPPQPAVGAALYEWGELHRLRGETSAAEEKYADAGRWGHDPQPGLALLRIAQGRPEAALRALHRTLAESTEPVERPTVLAACAEASVAVGDLAAARTAVDRLRSAAVVLDVPMAGALAAHAEAQVSLAAREAETALRSGRRAWTLWHELDAPHPAARSRVLVGRACRALGDEDAALMELEAACAVFADLGARGDAQETAALLAPGAGAAGPGPLTGRERQVLRLVADGLTNRAIASELFLSEKTVARHLSNIFVKLGVSTRTAAAAYAFEHDLA